MTLPPNITKLLPEEKSETSRIHTSDIHSLSSTQIGLEQNKGFNQCRQHFIDTVLPRVIEAHEAEKRALVENIKAKAQCYDASPDEAHCQLYYTISEEKLHNITLKERTK